MTFDPERWAESCFKRALQLNPQTVLAHTELPRVTSAQSDGEPLWSAPLVAQYERVAALPERKRFELFADQSIGDLGALLPSDGTTRTRRT